MCAIAQSDSGPSLSGAWAPNESPVALRGRGRTVVGPQRVHERGHGLSFEPPVDRQRRRVCQNRRVQVVREWVWLARDAHADRLNGIVVAGPAPATRPPSGAAGVSPVRSRTTQRRATGRCACRHERGAYHSLRTRAISHLPVSHISLGRKATAVYTCALAHGGLREVDQVSPASARSPRCGQRACAPVAGPCGGHRSSPSGRPACVRRTSEGLRPAERFALARSWWHRVSASAQALAT